MKQLLQYQVNHWGAFPPDPPASLRSDCHETKTPLHDSGVFG